ncbi:hypothetical protein ACS0TY_003055 [Phlomoides rotata]
MISFPLYQKKGIIDVYALFFLLYRISHSSTFLWSLIPEIPEKILELREQLIPGKTIKNLALERFTYDNGGHWLAN